MTKNVLVCPTELPISNARYGKSYNILNNLGSSEYDVTACTGWVDDYPTPQNVQVKTLNTRSRIKYFIRSFRYARRTLRSEPIDLYHHMNLTYFGFNPLLIGDRPDVPIIVGPAQASHTIPRDEFEMKIDWLTSGSIPRRLRDTATTSAKALRDFIVPLRKRLFRQTLLNSDEVIVVNQETKEIYSQFTAADKIEVIPIGVDVDFFSFNENRDDTKAVTVGRLVERKGFPDLFRAFVDVVEAFPETELHVIGDGPKRENYEAMVRRLGIANAVTFHGNIDQEDVRQHLQTARLFVHPSHSESFSPIRLEAMSTGCPVVVTDVIGAGEMVRNGVDGFVVPKRSPDSLASAMLTLFSDDAFTNKLGKSARRRAEQKYSWTRVGESYRDVYESYL